MCFITSSKECYSSLIFLLSINDDFKMYTIKSNLMSSYPSLFVDSLLERMVCTLMVKKRMLRGQQRRVESKDIRAQKKGKRKNKKEKKTSMLLSRTRAKMRMRMMMSSRASWIEKDEGKKTTKTKKKKESEKENNFFPFFLILLFMLYNFVMQDTTQSFLMRYRTTFSYRKTTVNILSVSSCGRK